MTNDRRVCLGVTGWPWSVPHCSRKLAAVAASGEALHATGYGTGGSKGKEKQDPQGASAGAFSLPAMHTSFNFHSGGRRGVF